MKGRGGFVGYDHGRNGIFESCFWDAKVNSDVNDVGTMDEPNVIGLTTGEMQTASTFTDAGWDFVGEVVNGPNDVWDICAGTNYPRLVWSISEADFLCPDGVSGEDYAYFASWWGGEECGDVNDCEGVDFDVSGLIDWKDFRVFCDYWLEE